jgi:diguanylate cyclase (GGDEF)-like protein
MRNDDVKKELRKLSQKIDIYKDEILKRNYKNFKSFAFGGMILAGLISLVAIVCWGRVGFRREYCLLFLHFVLCNLYIRWFLKKHMDYTLGSFYIAMAPILVIGIAMGTFLDPGGNAMTIIIMFCTFFMFITDKPSHIIGYILGSATLFLVCSYSCKAVDLFVADAVNLAIYLSVGLGVNMLTLKDRVESAENYVLAQKRADSDALTSLLNRGAGENIVKKALASGRKGSFIIIDIDDFKNINDSYGHQTGDEVIYAVSQQLTNVFQSTDVVWRLGGDEFAVFAIDLVSKELCEKQLRQVQDGVRGIKASYAKPLDITISMGCAICRSEGCEFDYIYKISDDALYAAKLQGKNRYVLHEI